MKNINAFKKQIEDDWISGFKKEFEIENLICEDYEFDEELHDKMGEVNSPDDFWNFYFKLKRNQDFIITKKLTVFQRTKATNFFIIYCGEPIIHWFFVQAIDALEHDLYIPACSAILNGIEASLRITIHQLEKSEDIFYLSSYQVLSNSLISKAKDFGLPTQALALPNEIDFESKLASIKPNRVDVEIVRIRNNICHGNLIEYIDTTLGKENAIFSPVCLRELALDLVNVSRVWIYSLGMFRIDKLLHGHLRFGLY